MFDCPEATGINSGIIRIQVKDRSQLFNTIDPSPFLERDLDTEAERFIVSWARDVPACAPLALHVELAKEQPTTEDQVAAVDAIHAFFERRSQTTQRELRTLLRRGRLSLAIGILFLSVCFLGGQLAARTIHTWSIGAILEQGLTVAGWVAMWRPMEIFLYDWWPLAGDQKLYSRLRRMPIRLMASSELSRTGESENGESAITRDGILPRGFTT